MPDEDPQLGSANALAPAIQWVPLGTLTVYHVTEQELDQLERGTPESTYFGFSVFLLSNGVAFLIALLTTHTESIRLYNSFLIATIIGLIGGLLLGTMWVRSKNTTKDIISTIRRRKPPVGRQQS